MKGLVISGGGVKGAFAVGVLKALQAKYIADNPSSPDPATEFFREYKVISGTSTGALIAPLASQARIQELEDLYTNPNLLKSYYQWKAHQNIPDIVTWENSVFDVTGLRNQLRSQLEPICTELLTNPDATTLFFAAVSMNTAELVYFTNKNRQAPAGSEYRIQTVTKLDEMLDAIMASANQPVFAPFVKIQNQNGVLEDYTDGGVREYAPIQGVLDQGVTEVDVILNSPAFFEWTTPAAGTKFALIDILNRTIDLLTGEVGTSDIQYAKRVVDVKSRQLQQPIRMRIFRPSKGSYGTDHKQPFPFKDNNLNFDRGKMVQMLDKGMEAVNAPTGEMFELYQADGIA